MRNRPILLSKIAHRGRIRTREVIGLIGTHHGTGVTHTALMLAFYLGEELGKRTALVECNGHRDMGLIQEAYEWHRGTGAQFSYHRVTCCMEAGPDRIVQLMGEDYEYILLDFGTDLMKNREELLRCSIRIAVGGQSEWDMRKLGQFIQKLDNIGGDDSWLYFIPRGKERVIQRIQKEIKQKIWAVPEVVDPTRMNHETRLFMKRCFNFR